MKGSLIPKKLPLVAMAAACAAVAAPARLASAAEHTFSWSDWWLPPLRSVHGASIDSLFIWIFWITMVALILVQVTLVVFLIKYRRRPANAKAHFIHGNTRLEMAWTLVPAVILAILAVASKEVWSSYRYVDLPDGEKAQIMVVGEQFKWNVVYPGPDGRIGRYLQYPKPSDPRYRMYSKQDATKRINDYIIDRNPLGQAPAIDPETGHNYSKDDDYDPTPGRPVIVPAGKTVEVLLGSKDVLHSFFLPNFRVKLDAVPGMIGKLYFKATETSTARISIDSIGLDVQFWLDRDTPGAMQSPDDEGEYYLADPKDPDSWFTPIDAPTLRSMAQRRLRAREIESPTDEQITAEAEQLRADFKAAGIEQMDAIVQPFEIVCEELCGSGHATMRGVMIVVSERQYLNFIHKNNPPTDSPGLQPAVPTVATVGAGAAGE